ncbi:MAG: hypothetical protein GY820_06095 [Gammaproteobacteria bacterium]|nr:hypothetical protein [Gammaproteobacteria bacterium]
MDYTANKKYRKYQIWARLSSVLFAKGEWELDRQLSAQRTVEILGIAIA